MVVKSVDSEVSHTWVQVLTLPVTHEVTLGVSFSFSVAQFPYP